MNIKKRYEQNKTFFCGFKAVTFRQKNNFIVRKNKGNGSDFKPNPDNFVLLVVND